MQRQRETTLLLPLSVGRCLRVALAVAFGHSWSLVTELVPSNRGRQWKTFFCSFFSAWASPLLMPEVEHLFSLCSGYFTEWFEHFKALLQDHLNYAPDLLLIKSLWMIRKVICSVNMYIVHLVVCTFCVFNYIQQSFGGTVYIIHNNQTTLLR